MLKRLRFKNWRSLRDVVIDDLQPITVFIGANSSGKTNILDALHFLRHKGGLVQAVYAWGGRHKFRTTGIGDDESIELEFSYARPAKPLLTWSISLQFQSRDVPFLLGSRVSEGDHFIFTRPPVEMPEPEGRKTESTDSARAYLLGDEFCKFARNRWQLLGENFMPPVSLSPKVAGDTYMIEPDARNVMFMLDFMQQTRPDLYNQLDGDLRWLLGHVDKVAVSRNDRETRMLIQEKSGVNAPTISTGTARIVAMLTAFYALDMRSAEMPGLVVIEEPDMALNPLLLQNFVEQLRNYVEGEHPRQVIMTTHNPRFLDWFKPEEVRVVERDEQGYTTVNRISESIKRIWLDKYTLGEVWMTLTMGGVPE